MTLLRTTTFFACQKESFVSKWQLSNCESLIYWNEYFPFKVTFSNVSREDRIMKYSLSAVQSFMFTPCTDQPNSGEMMSQL